MTITGKLHIDGIIEGTISSIEDVSIGRTGYVKGFIKAKSISVSGLLEGEIQCDSLHIASGGRVVASVTSLELMTDANSQFIGDRRQSEFSIIDKAAEQAQIADSLESDILDNLPSKITLDSQVDSDQEAHSLESDSLGSPEDSGSLQSPDLNVDSDKTKEELNEPQAKESTEHDSSLDDLGVLNDLEGLEFLDELDKEPVAAESKESIKQSEVTKKAVPEKSPPQKLDMKNKEGKQVLESDQPQASAVIKVVTELNSDDAAKINQSTEPKVAVDEKQPVEQKRKPFTTTRNSQAPKRIDEKTTKLELKF